MSSINFNTLIIDYPAGKLTIGKVFSDLPTPQPTQTPTPTPTMSPSPTPSPTRSPTPTSSPTPTPTPSRSATPTPTASPSPSPTPGSTGFVNGNLQMKLDISNFTSGSTTWTNLQSTGNNGVLTNGPIPLSGSIQFDGTNDYMTFTSGALMKPSTTQSITLQAWIYPTSQRNTGLYGKLSSSYGYDGYILSYQSGITYSTTNGASLDKRVNGTNAKLITNNQWQMVTYITVINNTSGSTQAYVDTTQVLAGSHGADSYSESNFLRVAQGYHGDTGSAFTGRIAEFYYYDKALTLNEITNNFNSTKGKFGIS